MTIDGKTTEIKENTAFVINKGSNAKFEVTKGYPMLMASDKNFDWYSNYSNQSDDQMIKNKYAELMWINARLYNGEIHKNKFDQNVVNKLIEKEIVDVKDNDYVKFKHYYVPEYQAKELEKNGFSKRK